MSEKELSGGVVHDLPTDLKKALIADAKAVETWEDITPLARNEWICWIESAKKAETRTRRGSNGAVPTSGTERGDPVAGLAVRIVEIEGRLETTSASGHKRLWYLFALACQPRGRRLHGSRRQPDT